jgi:hypothetical protein
VWADVGEVAVSNYDVFQEVDEEVRKEQLQKLWERYQYYAYAAATVVLLAVGGWRGYDWYATKQAAETGTAFEEAAILGEKGEHADAEGAFAKIAAGGTSGYRALARLRQVAELAERDPRAAIAGYERIAGDNSVGQVFQDLAGLRAGALLIDQANYDIARARLEPLASPGRTFRHTAREMLALAAWRSGDTAAAKRWFDLIMTDGETPSATRNRIEMLIALVAAESKS